MMKEDREQEQRLPDRQRGRVGTDQSDLHQPDDTGESHLPEMEAQPRPGVEIEVDVVNAMESPEKRRTMIHPVPDPECVIEEKDPGDDAQRTRQRHLPKQSLPLSQHFLRPGPYEALLHEGSGHRAHRGHGEVAQDVPGFLLNTAPKWPDLFQYGDRDESEGEECSTFRAHARLQ